MSAVTATAAGAVSPAATVPLLSIDGLRVSYGTSRRRTEALHGVGLQVGRGETVAVVGESGSGKSTTAHAVIQLLPPGGRVDAGRIALAGEAIDGYSDRRMRAVRGARIGLIPQDPMSSLNPLLKIGRQVQEALRVHGRLQSDPEDQTIRMLQEAGLPHAARVAAQYPHQLSGGMRQRVLIAIALACDPELVIADEPTSALDVTVQRVILDHIEERKAAIGASVLFITHDLGVAADRADRIVVMNRGRVVEEGTVDQVLGAPADPYTRRLLAAAPSLSSSVLYAAPDAAAGSRPVLVVRDLRKTFPTPDGELVAVEETSFEVAAGETLGIVGESGSGKSTTARLVLRLEDADSGTIALDGTDISHLRGDALRPYRREMQMVYQNPYSSLSPHLSVGDIVAEPLRIHRVGTRAERRERAQELIRAVALDPSMLERRAAELSGGQRQRVAIARALALEPRLIVCDEAVSALDVSVQAQILELLAEVQRERGVAYLFITHDLAVVRQIAHRVLVMKNGRVVESGPTPEVFADPREEYTRELLRAIPGRPRDDP